MVAVALVATINATSTQKSEEDGAKDCRGTGGQVTADPFLDRQPLSPKAGDASRIGTGLDALAAQLGRQHSVCGHKTFDEAAHIACSLQDVVRWTHPMSRGRGTPIAIAGSSS
ncbi:hypothetical protein A7X12_17220 [Sphingomonas sp. TDK1]|nr:hypothetical protein A7X12_17220 [Sphingomonas sp. TDK1]